MSGPDDRGIATVGVVALAYFLLLVAIVVGGLSSLVAARTKAATVADLAAIAAIQGSGCGAAAGVAEANDMSMTACESRGGDAVVEVTAPPPVMLMKVMDWLGQASPSIRVSARAGWG